MASKTKGHNQQRDHTTLKFVRKAKNGLPIFSWVKTICTAGKFTQSWSQEKPE